MLADRRRMDFYHAAIARHIHPGDRVIDLGTGTGILAAFASRAGAATVYAIDHSRILKRARKLAAHNGVANVEFIATHSKDFALAERVDVILHEQMGDWLFNEAMVANVIDLRDRLAAALKLVATGRPRWSDRLLRRNAPGGAAWQEGLRMTVRRLDQVLLDRGVVATHLVGRPFDPRQARVVATAADASVAEGTVIEEVRTGFLWGDQVLRTAEVIVSKGGAGKGEHS